MWQESCSGPSRRELLQPGIKTLAGEAKVRLPRLFVPFLEAEAVTFVGRMTLQHECIQEERRERRSGGGRGEAGGGWGAGDDTIKARPDAFAQWSSPKSGGAGATGCIQRHGNGPAEEVVRIFLCEPKPALRPPLLDPPTPRRCVPERRSVRPELWRESVQEPEQQTAGTGASARP